MEMKKKGILFGLMILLTLAFVISFMLGHYSVRPIVLMEVLMSKVISVEQTWEKQVETIIFNVRLPRILMAIIVGASLSTVGATYQGVFQNPMVSPDVLGASAGAGFGAALGISFSMGYWGISMSAFVFSLITVSIVCLISRCVKNQGTLGLVLSGMMVGSLFSSATSYLKLVADPNDELPAITYWLMGSLASIRQADIKFVILPILIGLIPLYILRWQINLLAMGDEEAHSMGVNVTRLRLIVILCSTLVTGACVSVSGMIGWIGLIIPHFSRILVGSNYKTMLPACSILGGLFLLIVDNFARLMSTAEVPIGILTAFIGAPFFLFLIVREGKKEWF